MEDEEVCDVEPSDCEESIDGMEEESVEPHTVEESMERFAVVESIDGMAPSEVEQPGPYTRDESVELSHEEESTDGTGSDAVQLQVASVKETSNGSSVTGVITGITFCVPIS